MNKRVLKILANKKFYKIGVKTQVGRFIPIYWDPKASLSDPMVLKVIAEEFSRMIKKIRPKIEVIAGGATGGIGLAAATALETGLPWVYIRPEPKGYSTNLSVEGDYRKGARAVLVDDVIATGSAKEKFLKNARGQLKIKNIIVILDDTGRKYSTRLKKQNVRLHSMFTKKERDKYYFRKIGFFRKEAMELEEAYEKDREGWWKTKVNWQKFLKFKKQGL